MICIGIASCSRQGKKETANSIEEYNHVQTVPFNLATLIVGQNINDILKSAGVTIKDTIHTNDITLIGNDRLAFSSTKILHMDGTDLDGKNNTNINNVLLHYAA